MGKYGMFARMKKGKKGYDQNDKENFRQALSGESDFEKEAKRAKDIEDKKKEDDSWFKDGGIAKNKKEALKRLKSKCKRK
jgi:hypothetical protein